MKKLFQLKESNKKRSFQGSDFLINPFTEIKSLSLIRL